MDCDLQTLTADSRNRTCFRQGLHHRIPNVVPFGNTSPFGGLFRHGFLPVSRHGFGVSCSVCKRRRIREAPTRRERIAAERHAGALHA